MGAFLPAEATRSGAAYAEQPAAAFSLASGATLECELPRTLGGDPGQATADPDPGSSTGALDEEDEEALLERLTAREAAPPRAPPVLRLRSGSARSETPAPSPGPSRAASGGGGGGRAGPDGGWSDPVALLPGSTSVGGGRWRVRVWRRGCTTHAAVSPGATSQSAPSKAGSTGAATPSCSDASNASSGCRAPAGAPLSVQIALESLQVAIVSLQNATPCMQRLAPMFSSL